MAETFGYDNLHRVTGRTVTQAFALNGNLGMSESYGYDANGNIINKTGVGHYQYNVSGKPNRLAAVWQNSNFSGTKHYNFTYDSNGNVTNDGKRSYTYTSFDLPSLVTQGSDTTSFSYGPNRELIKRIDARSTGTTTTLLIDNLYQQISLPSGVIEHKFMVGNAVVTRRTGEGGYDVFYLYKDQQGSTTMVTNYLGNVVQQLLYDPWGRQYQVSANVLKYSNNALTKGYTGHDMVNDFEVIHMGGRTYNPVLGRFMQADPFIQQASNLQSFNRYAYVLNNPMSYTDPSGYFFKKLFSFVKENWRSLVSIAVGYFTFGLGTGIWNLAQMGSLGFGTAVGWGAVAGAASGFVATGSLRGALTGAISGAAFGALGGLGLNGMENFAASGLLGGALTDLQGGKFGHGFLSAGIGAVAGGRFGPNPYAQVIGAAIVGGTVSAITGGKFANGAVGAAFAAALRADWDSNPVPQNSKVAFVGGAADDNPAGSRVVRDAYDAHIAKYGKDSAAYFEWTEYNKLALWVDQAGGNATIIAHSYGADMAAQVVANGHLVDRLVTVDPVGWIRPDMAQVAANTNIWQNYDAGDSLNNWNNIVATVGGAWNTAPQGYATTNQKYSQLDHVQICYYFCKY